MAQPQQKFLSHALQWYIDQGVDEALLDAPQDRTVAKAAAPVRTMPVVEHIAEKKAPSPAPMLIPVKSELYEQAVTLATQAQTLDDLRAAIQNFDGIALKKTATNLVFSDGNPQAPIMLVGEAPGADEDRIGRPFVGISGQLLDRILACIGIDRKAEDPMHSIYIANILNWRPPGNRNPTPGEVELSLPFIERHIQLIKPKILIFCGGVSAKSLLGSEESVSKLRKSWHDYKPLTPALRAEAGSIPAIVTYHPSYLLRTPSQKKAVWGDMLSLDDKRKALQILP